MKAGKPEVWFKVETIEQLKELAKRRVNPEDTAFGNPTLMRSVMSVWAANNAHNAGLKHEAHKPIDMRVYVRGIWMGSKYAMSMVRRRGDETKLMATLKADMRWYRANLKEAEV